MSHDRGLKDDRLAQLATERNVARFVSFSPGAHPEPRHSLVTREYRPGPETDIAAAIAAVLDASSEHSVNVRSFLSDQDKGGPLKLGLTRVPDVVSVVRDRAERGYFTIVNETINVNDGGVSGVLLGGVAEFAPDDTPRAVEEAGTASLPVELAQNALATVYGFAPNLEHAPDVRLEFSIHPQRVGYRNEHVLWWESEDVTPVALRPSVRWPNKFSRHLGDKAYGLMIGSVLDLPVPLTTVVGRRVRPFSFGQSTGTAEWWLRTCPSEQAPGRYTTLPHWADPYWLMSEEDPTGEHIVSIIAQEAVDATWSGATIPARGDAPDYVEGVAGGGDLFMLGQRSPDRVPHSIADDVRDLISRANKALGPVRIEWVHDGDRPWLIQLHTATQFFDGDGVLSPGEADAWLTHNVTDGLDQLRSLIPDAIRRGAGIVVNGDVGLTSHVGDLLRKAGVPGRLSRPHQDDT